MAMLGLTTGLISSSDTAGVDTIGGGSGGATGGAHDASNATVADSRTVTG
jgi:hypothetical protein